MPSHPTHYPVPREDGAFLLQPDAAHLEGTIQENLRIIQRLPDWVQSLRSLARQEAIEESIAYGMEVGRAHSVEDHSLTLVIGGHQPELFHPGVWFKNFVLYQLTEKTNRNALHVIIDHDTVRDVMIKSPIQDGRRLNQRFIRMPVAPSWELLPWENTRVTQELAGVWLQQIDRVIDDARHFGLEPILATYRAQIAESLRIGEPFSSVTSRLRQQAEAHAGLHNAEVPMSRLSSRRSFGEFVYHCMQQAPVLFEAYQAAREDFRLSRRITNPTQPVPELKRIGDWIEMPFWLFRSRSSFPDLPGSWIRKGAWGKWDGKRIILADQPSESASLLLEHDDESASWNESFRNWNEQGVCIRPRALMTTLFLRLFVGDLFVHGIGGGVYDAVTDKIAEKLWGIQMPEYVVASAAIHLPLKWQQTGTRLSRLDWLKESHRFRSSPETFLDENQPDHSRLKHQFQDLLQRVPSKEKKAAWHRKISDLRRQIRELLKDTGKELEEQSLKLIEHEREAAILHSREYSIAIFPLEQVTEKLAALSRRAQCTACTSSETGDKVDSRNTTTLAVREC